ncbi:hypothetical protein [Paenibacillus guangzhouensis]|uniref:hypothetical protein n=1 Tax=Paenibacillus guangzhouensis TaxID=1473112 RepID=UPI001266B894|nr:hypothetical protein [Paenibacillus guangzhouensis]
MLNKLTRLGCMFTVVSWIGGCSVPSMPADLIKPPLKSEDANQDTTKQELLRLLPHEAQVQSPIQAKQGNDISYGDLDGDGINEAVVVYEKPGTKGKALQAVVFKHHQEGWSILSELKGFGYGLEYAEFPDLNHDGQAELVLSWSLGAAGQGLDVYTWIDNTLKLLSKQEYEDHLN